MISNERHPIREPAPAEVRQFGVTPTGSRREPGEPHNGRPRRGKREHPISVAADQQRHRTVRPPFAERTAVECEPLALVRHGLTGEQTARHVDEITHSVDADRWPLVDDTKRRVLDLCMTGTDPERAPSRRQLLERAHRPSEQRRMPEVVVDHQGAQLHRRRHRRRSGEWHERIDEVEVVGDPQPTDAALLPITNPLDEVTVTHPPTKAHAVPHGRHPTAVKS